MQLVTPRVVMMAVRMLMMSWMMNFHVSLFIVVIGYSYFSNTNQHEYTRIIFLGTNASEDATNQHECAWWQAAEPSAIASATLRDVERSVIGYSPGAGEFYFAS